MNEYSSAYYFDNIQSARKVKAPIGASRYNRRARSIKRIDPNGIYGAFNLSNNKEFSTKPSIGKGSAIIG